MEPEVVDLGRSRFDLGVTVSEEAAGLGVSVEYATDVFDRWRVEGLVAHFERVLWALVDDVAVRVSQVELLSSGERAELVAAGCGRVLEVAGQPLHVVVAQRAAAVPDAVAVVFEGRECRTGSWIVGLSSWPGCCAGGGSAQARWWGWRWSAARTWWWRCWRCSRRAPPTRCWICGIHPSVWR